MKKIKLIIILCIPLITGFFIAKWLYQVDEDQYSNKDKQLNNRTWTCAMHQQIEKQEPGQCPICGMDLIPKKTSGSMDQSIVLSDQEIKLGGIRTMKVSRGSRSSKIKLEGEIIQNEKLSRVQTTHFSGRIEKLYINFTGEQVRKNQPLAKIYAPKLVVAQEELLAAQDLKKQQPGIFNNAKNKLKRWKISEEQIQKILENGEAQENFTIYADQSGYVTEKMVAEGQYIKTGEALFSITPLNQVWASLDIYENQMEAIHEGMPITIRQQPGGKVIYQGSIDFIDPVINKEDRTAKARVTIDNSEKQLKPGAFITGLVQPKASDKLSAKEIIIPRSAVLWTGQTSLVFVQTASDPQTIFEAREVNIANGLNGQEYSISSGLVDDETIVVNGAFTVDAAAQLEGKKSMLAQKAETPREKKAMPVKDDLLKLSKAYLVLKDLLVASDFEQASEQVDVLSAAVQAVEITQNIGAWRQHKKALMNSIKNMQSAEKLTEIRKEFELLSNAIIQLAKDFQLDREILYIQYCPMVDSGGAYWLSRSDQVMNPYFGEEMLHCGSVKNRFE